MREVLASRGDGSATPGRNDLAWVRGKRSCRFRDSHGFDFCFASTLHIFQWLFKNVAAIFVHEEASSVGPPRTEGAPFAFGGTLSRDNVQREQEEKCGHLFAPQRKTSPRSSSTKKFSGKVPSPASSRARSGIQRQSFRAEVRSSLAARA